MNVKTNTTNPGTVVSVSANHRNLQSGARRLIKARSHRVTFRMEKIYHLHNVLPGIPIEQR
jgi:hypothetical protein